MPFNLIADPWLPVRRLSGGREWIAPSGLTSHFTDDPIVALDFPRPDWNAAVTELLIGLLATVMAPEDTTAWADLWEKPPTPEALAEKLATVRFAFNLDGDGPRCFQDFDPLTNLEPKPVAALLIDAAGENAEKKNTDLFVKRAGDTVMGPAMAAAALITLQTFAPAGGQGNRTSTRGGGPLQTLPLPRRKLNSPGGPHAVTTLWDLVWSAVPDQTSLEAAPTEPDEAVWPLIFPWLAPTRSSEGDRATLPEHGHALQQFFGTPRRIRLDFAPANGDHCAFEGPASDMLISTFRQKNYGVKYEGWVHPLTPYRADKKEGLLAFHPQPGGATYRDWMTWVQTPREKTSQRAACLDTWRTRLGRLNGLAAFAGAFETGEPWQSGVLACGYDMDNMKARGWLEARVPFFDPPVGAADTWSDEFRRTAEQLVAGTEESAKALRPQIKIAIAGVRNRDGRYQVPDTMPKDAFAEVIEGLWRATEPQFRKALAVLSAQPADPDRTVRTAFLSVLRRQGLEIFDSAVGTDTLADQDARRIVMARSQLQAAFGPRGSVSRGLDLMAAPDADAKPKGKGRPPKKKDVRDA